MKQARFKLCLTVDAQKQYKVRDFGVWSLVTALLISVFPGLGMAEDTALRGLRYCEVIFSKGRVFEVYNSIRLSDCPDPLWQKITVQTLKKETGALYVYLNGPRKLMVDGVKDTPYMDPNPKVFQNIAMRKTAILHLSLHDILLGDKPYHEHRVERNTTWMYAAGKTVYELIDPQGHVFVMQSFTLTANTQSEQDLARLAHKIKLPNGWKFKTGMLQTDRAIPAVGNESIVVQDNFKNIYQRAKGDFL